jgi:hypothetical protein
MFCWRGKGEISAGVPNDDCKVVVVEKPASSIILGRARQDRHRMAHAQRNRDGSRQDLLVRGGDLGGDHVEGAGRVEGLDVLLAGERGD